MEKLHQKSSFQTRRNKLKNFYNFHFDKYRREINLKQLFIINFNYYDSIYNF